MTNNKDKIDFSSEYLYELTDEQIIEIYHIMADERTQTEPNILTDTAKKVFGDKIEKRNAATLISSLLFILLAERLEEDLENEIDEDEWDADFDVIDKFTKSEIISYLEAYGDNNENDVEPIPSMVVAVYGGGGVNLDNAAYNLNDILVEKLIELVKIDELKQHKL